MKPGRDAEGNWLREATEEELDALTDEEIAAAVASDPDAAPIRTEEEMEAADARARERDTYGVFRLLRRLKVSGVVFADRYRIPYRTLRAWERGELEPDPASKVLLAAIAADPEFMARAAERARNPSFLLPPPPARAAAE